jgi:leader peptidase (prepilin peptidase)/N-methyltransferase
MDLKYMIIADELQIALGLASIPLFLKDPVNHIIGAIVLSAIFYGIYRITKRKGMGFGDVKLTFVMGLLLGWYEGLIAVYLSFILGGIVGIILLLLKKKGMKSKVAFGPFLVIGTAIMLLFPDKITHLIEGWFGI